jgi:hypothetical protein
MHAYITRRNRAAVMPAMSRRENPDIKQILSAIDACLFDSTVIR